MSIYHHDGINPSQEEDEDFPWGDNIINIDQLWAEDVIQKLLDEIFTENI